MKDLVVVKKITKIASDELLKIINAERDKVRRIRMSRDTMMYLVKEQFGKKDNKLTMPVNSIFDRNLNSKKLSRKEAMWFAERESLSVQKAVSIKFDELNKLHR